MIDVWVNRIIEAVLDMGEDACYECVLVGRGFEKDLDYVWNAKYAVVDALFFRLFFLFGQVLVQLLVDLLHIWE